MMYRWRVSCASIGDVSPHNSASRQLSSAPRRGPLAPPGSLRAGPVVSADRLSAVSIGLEKEADSFAALRNDKQEEIESGSASCETQGSLHCPFDKLRVRRDDSTKGGLFLLCGIAMGDRASCISCEMFGLDRAGA